MIRATIIALIILALGVILLAWFLVRIYRRLVFQPDDKLRRRPPGGVSYFGIAIAILMLLISWLMLSLTNQLKSFRPFTPATGIGRITAKYENDPVKTLNIEFVYIDAAGKTAPTTFYLSGNSWYIKGQYVILPKFLKHIFQWQSYCRITDFYADFAGHKPPGVNVPLLAHQVIGGESEDLIKFVRFAPFIKDQIKICEFTSVPVKTTDRLENFEIILSDSCSVTLNRIE
jgi:hypothetical protein